MITRIKKFAVDETGAITVEWVVLTASIVGLAIAVIAGISLQSTDNADSLEQYLSDIEVEEIL